MSLKLDNQLPLKVSVDTKNALDRIAEAKSVTAAELLRRAAYAIIAYAEIYGDRNVPLDMEIAQLKISPAVEASQSLKQEALKKAAGKRT